MTAIPPGTSQASTTALLTALQNVVTALNSQTQATLSIAGLTVATAISAATVVKTAAGRVCRVSVTTAGSAVGHIYDANQLGVTTKPLWVIPEAAQPNGEPFDVGIPAAYGVLVVPGTGQTVAVSYS
jgi:hypothetical protein